MDPTQKLTEHTPGSDPGQETDQEAGYFIGEPDLSEEVSVEEASDDGDEESFFFRPTLSRRERLGGAISAPLEDANVDSDTADSDSAAVDDDSEVDREWEESPSMYYLNRDEVEAAWARSRPRLTSFLGAPRGGTSSPASVSPRDSDDVNFAYARSENGRRRHRDDVDDEDDDEYEVVDKEEESSSFDWVVPMGHLPQEDYTWEQLHPTAARVLSIAENLPGVQGARHARAALVERAQPYVAAARERYDTAAARITGAARVANELAIVTVQVGGWLIGEARQAIEGLQPVVRPLAERLRDHVLEQVGGGWRVAQLVFREYMAAVEPFPIQAHLEMARMLPDHQNRHRHRHRR